MASPPVDEKPGYYPSELEAYPGHICFPYPLTLPQFKVWWKASVESVKELTRLDFNSFNAEWEGAKRLLIEFGEWEIKGVPIGEVKADNVPLEVVSWVCDCAEDYIWPQLSSKKQRTLSTVT